MPRVANIGYLPEWNFCSFYMHALNHRHTTWNLMAHASCNHGVAREREADAESLRHTAGAWDLATLPDCGMMFKRLLLFPCAHAHGFTTPSSFMTESVAAMVAACRHVLCTIGRVIFPGLAITTQAVGCQHAVRGRDMCLLPGFSIQIILSAHQGSLLRVNNLKIKLLIHLWFQILVRYYSGLHISEAIHWHVLRG